MIVKSFTAVFLILHLLTPGSIAAADPGETELTHSRVSKRDKIILTNVAGLSAITLWGIANWDYFAASPSFKKEGWFSADTREGGADKLGHLYTSYILSHLLSGIYRNWGYDPARGSLLGALTSFAAMSWMELGDSFSDYGFSPEDFIMNTLGCATAYFMENIPGLSDKIDLRVEYRPRFDQADIFTDYDHQTFLVAFKLDGFDTFANGWAGLLELQLGYAARGYSGKSYGKRHISIGLGLNVPKILERLGMRRLSRVTRYFQIPFTRVDMDKPL